MTKWSVSHGELLFLSGYAYSTLRRRTPVKPDLKKDTHVGSRVEQQWRITPSESIELTADAGVNSSNYHIGGQTYV